jgi:hypothetical protein
MKMPDWIKQFLPPPKATKEEARHLRHELKNSIQAIQGGNRILQSMSGVIELNRRNPR